MSTAIVSESGRLEIPPEILKALRLEPGDEAVFEITGDDVLVRRRGHAASLAGVLKSDKGVGVSWDEIRRVAWEKSTRNWAGEE